MNELTQFLMSHGGPVLFAIVFVEQAGLPLPSAPWLLAAGALSATGKLNPVLALAMTALACVVADSIWFYVGRRGGQRVLHLFCRLSLAPSTCVGRTKGLFARRSEEHTSELQSRQYLVCRLLLEKKRHHDHRMCTSRRSTDRA